MSRLFCRFIKEHQSNDERAPFTLQKVPFYIVKHGILESQCFSFSLLGFDLICFSCMIVLASLVEVCCFNRVFFVVKQ